jgi:hypothetical protein
VDTVALAEQEQAGVVDADHAEAYALSILRAVRQLDAGLPDTPGGIPAVLASLDPPAWPPGAPNTHQQEGDTHG